uniref:Uncharacterized protein n=1 Tax=Cacopsylla melanoneura TaxID=428564 RepID=A0A8D8ZMA8_9HEMI
MGRRGYSLSLHASRRENRVLSLSITLNYISMISTLHLTMFKKLISKENLQHLHMTYIIYNFVCSFPKQIMVKGNSVKSTHLKGTTVIFHYYSYKIYASHSLPKLYLSNLA